MFEYTTAADNEIAEAFSSPSKNPNAALVEHLKTLGKGQAIKLPKKHGLKSDRSLKRQVNSAAKDADRTLEWSELPDWFVARVVTVSTNGTAASNNTVEATTETPASSEAETATASRRR